MKTITYQNYSTYIDGTCKKAFRKLIKWLKNHPDFEGEIKIYSWAEENGKVDITIKSNDVEVKI